MNDSEKKVWAHLFMSCVPRQTAAGAAEDADAALALLKERDMVGAAADVLSERWLSNNGLGVYKAE